MLLDREEALEKAITDLEAAEDGYESLLVAEAGIDTIYEEATARAYIEARGTIPEKEHQATLATVEHKKQLSNLQALVKAQSSRIKSALAILSARQSLLSNDKNRRV